MAVTTQKDDTGNLAADNLSDQALLLMGRLSITLESIHWAEKLTAARHKLKEVPSCRRVRRAAIGTVRNQRWFYPWFEGRRR